MRNRFTTAFALLPSHAPLAFDQPPAGLGPLIGNSAADELCQLATPWKGMEPPAAPSIAQVKVDGHRALYFGGRQLITTREGNLLTAAWHCIPALHMLERAFGQPMFIDGEIAAPEGLVATNIAFKRGRPDPRLTFWVFDAVPLDQWIEDNCPMPTLPRMVRAERAYERAAREYPGVSGLPSVGLLLGAPVASADDMRGAAGEAWRQGHEGIVVKRSDGLYRRRRSPDWIKINERTRTLLMKG